MDKELRIKECASEHGMTIKDVSEKLGLNYVAYCNGLRNNPTLTTLKKTAKAIGVPTRELFAKNEFVAIVIDGDDAKVFRDKEKLKEYL